MASERAPSRAARRRRSLLRRVGSAVGVAIVAGFGLFALALLVLRFVVFPRVDGYRDSLTATLAAQLGQPVEVAGLATGWDGWNPKLVVTGLRVFDRARASEVPLMELPEVDLVVAWTSLPLMQLRLKELSIERPRLAVRRDRGGTLRVAGLEFDPAQASDESPLVDWVLRQRQIVVRDALVTWNDDLRNAPQLVLDRVQIRLENRGSHHRFGIAGTPPRDLAAPLDVRGDVSGDSLKEWQKASGQVYVRLDYANVEAWREWLPLPPAIASGQGAVRAWFGFAGGEAREVVADLELAGVRARLAEGLPPLELDHVSGRAGWRVTGGGQEYFTRDLTFVTAVGERLDATDFTLTMAEGSEGRAASGRIEFDRLQLEPLRKLAAYLPLPDRWRADLARYAPKGTLSKGRFRWQGSPEAPTAFEAGGEFTGLGISAQDALPGATGLGGSFTANEKGGELKLATRAASLDLPRVFARPIPLDSLQGGVRWERVGDRTRVDIARLDFSNAHAAGNVAGTYRTSARGPGEIDVTAQLARGDPREIHRYVPLVVGEATRTWLARALVKGEVNDARLKLAGDLARFPFADGKDGQFIVTVKARGVTLDYVDGWPAITDGDADIRFDGAAMAIDAARGRVFDAQLGRTRATIADLRAEAPAVVVEGTAAGPLADFVRFVRESPVDALTHHVLEDAEAGGNGQLALRLDLPLGRPERARVAGEFQFVNGQLRYPGIPRFTQINGKFAFAQNDVRAREIAAEVAGGPVKASAATADGRVRLTAAGTANLASLRREVALPYVGRVSGVTDWGAIVTVYKGTTAWLVESGLKGATIDLPSPLGKAAADTVPVRIELRADDAHPDEDTVLGSYGRVLQVVAHRRQVGAEMRADRALVSLGRAAGRGESARADRPGVWVRGDLPTLNADDWLALRERERAATPGRDLGEATPAGVDLEVGAFELFGRRFNDLRVSARRTDEDWKLDLRGKDVAGTATWSAPGASAANGRIAARLARFSMPGPAELPAWGGAERAADPRAPAGAGGSWPELDIEADSFVSKGRDLGRLELVAQPGAAEWRISKLALSGEEGRIDAEGAWRGTGKQQQTKLEVALDAKDAGAFLARFGLPDAVRGAPTTIRGQLAWAGSPAEFDFPTLSGTLRLVAGPGRFVKIEPGVGKLVGVMSLQSLPRRVTLDFQDVFSEGFAFDEITGNVRVASGVLSTDNLRLVGPAAKVDIAGEADLARETQRLTVRVQPAISASVSAGAALLFLANPIVGAAVGAGSLLAQKVMKDPIEQLFSYQYTVTGGWADPVVTRSGSQLTSIVPGTPGALNESLTK